VGQCAIKTCIRVDKPPNTEFDHLPGKLNRSDFRLRKPAPGLHHPVFSIDANDNVISPNVLDSRLNLVWGFDCRRADDHPIDSHVDQSTRLGGISYTTSEMNRNVDRFNYRRNRIRIATNPVSGSIKVNDVQPPRTLIDPPLCNSSWIIIEHGLSVIVALS
jgi:hypothetical protein